MGQPVAVLSAVVLLALAVLPVVELVDQMVWAAPWIVLVLVAVLVVVVVVAV